MSIQNTSPVLEKLVLSKGSEEMKFFGEFFDLIVGSDNLEIPDPIQTSEAGLQVFTGTVDIWAGPGTIIKISFESKSGNKREAVSVLLSKRITEIEGLSIPNLNFGDLFLRLKIELEGSSLNYEREIEGMLNGNIPFSLSGLGSDTYTLESRLQEGREPGFTELVSLLGSGDDLSDETLKDALGGRDIVLKSLSASLEPGQSNVLQKLSRVSTELAVSGDRWEIIPGFDFLKVGDLKIALAVDYPLESDYRFATFALSGAIILGTSKTAHLLIQARWPDLAISGNLAPDNELQINALLQDLDIATEGVPDSLKVTQLNFQAEPVAPRLFSFFMNIESDWRLNIIGNEDQDLYIKQVSLALRYEEQGSGEGAAVKGTFTGTFGIAGMSFFLSASNEDSDKGFTFSGGLTPDSTIEVGTLVDDLLTKLKADFELPDVLRSLEIHRLETSFNTHSKDFFFGIGTSMLIRENANDSTQNISADLELSLDFRPLGEDYLLTVSGILTIDDMQFSLELEKSKADTSLNFLFFDNDGFSVRNLLAGDGFLSKFNDEGDADLAPLDPEGLIDTSKIDIRIYQLGLLVQLQEGSNSFTFNGQFYWDTGFKLIETDPETLKLIANFDITKKKEGTPKKSSLKGHFEGLVALPIEGLELLKLGIIYKLDTKALQKHQLGLVIQIGSIRFEGSRGTTTDAKGKSIAVYNFEVTAEPGDTSGESPKLKLMEVMGFFGRLVDPSIDEFSFEPPWDSILGAVEVDLSNISFSLAPKAKSISFSYSGSPIVELPPFLQVDSISIGYAKVNKRKFVTFNIEGDFLGKSSIGWDPINDPPPSIPGKGGKFDLKYIGLGQRVGLKNIENVQSISSVMSALAGSLDRSRQAYIENPEKRNEAPTEASNALEFNADSGWLIGTQFSLYETVTVSIILNDPLLYGLRLDVTGGQSYFEGLSFEIFYQRLSKTLGKFHAELSMPPNKREVRMGALVINMPTIIITVFTNGNFTVDLGFPHNRDFSRSFGMESFPFIGSGGFYVSKLDSKTAKSVPQITDGEFTPVLEFGIGLSIGLGKTFEEGPIEGELSIKVEGIIAGVYSTFNPTDTNRAKAEFFKLSGSVSLVGRIYGKADFLVVSASIDITGRATAIFDFEVYKATDFTLEAEVKVELKVTVLGAEITKSWKKDLEESFTIGEDTTPPWREVGTGSPFTIGARGNGFAVQGAAMRTRSLSARSASPDLIWNTQLLNSTIEEFTIFLQPAISLDASGAKGLALLFIENAVSTGTIGTENHTRDARNKNSDFDSLLQLLLKWALHAYLPTSSDDLEDREISLDVLRKLFGHFIENAHEKAFSYTQLSEFLENNVSFHIKEQTGSISCSFFPMPPEIKLGLGGGSEVDFEDTYKINQARFDQIKANKKSFDINTGPQADPKSDTTVSIEKEVPLAQLIFLDYFRLISRSTIQAGIDFMKKKHPSDKILIRDLLDALNTGGEFNHIAGMASHFMLHGLRLPDINNSGSTEGLYEALGQQFDLFAAKVSPTEQNFQISLQKKANSGDRIHFTDTTDNKLDISWNDTNRHTALFEMGRAFERIENPHKVLPQLHNNDRLDLLEAYQEVAKRFPLSQAISFGSKTIFPFSETKLQFLQDRAQRKSLLLKRNLIDSDLPDEELDKSNFELSTRIKLKVARNTGEKTNRSYTLGALGVTEQNWIEDIITRNKDLRLELALPVDAQNSGLDPAPDGAAIFLYKNNLSGQINGANSDFVASISEKSSFLKLLWESGKVSEGGFHLYYAVGDDGLPDHIFETSNQGELELIITLTNPDDNPLAAYHNCILSSTLTSDDLKIGLFFEESEARVPVLQIPPGHLGFRFTRDNVSQSLVTGPPTATLSEATDLLENHVIGSTVRVPDLAIGTVLEFISFKDVGNVEWVEVEHNGQVGWILSDKLTVEFPNLRYDPPSATLIRASELRNKPGSDSTSLKSLSINTELLYIDTVVFNNEGTNEEWIEVDHQGISGFIAKDDIDIDLAELQNLYQMLGFCITKTGNDKTPGFDNSQEGLPVGPTIQNGNSSEWIYDRLVPIFRFANQAAKNRVIEQHESLAPPAEFNPYVGIGIGIASLVSHDLNLQFFWQDLFGNRLKSDDPNMGVSFPVKYYDPIIGIKEWPSVAETYTFVKNKAGETRLLIELEFDPSPYLESSVDNRDQLRSKIKAARAKYEQIYFQVADPNLSVKADAFADLIPPDLPKNDFLTFLRDAYYFLSRLEDIHQRGLSTTDSANFDNVDGAYFKRITNGKLKVFVNELGIDPVRKQSFMQSLLLANQVMKGIIQAEKPIISSTKSAVELGASSRMSKGDWELLKALDLKTKAGDTFFEIARRLSQLLNERQAMSELSDHLGIGAAEKSNFIIFLLDVHTKLKTLLNSDSKQKETLVSVEDATAPIVVTLNDWRTLLTKLKETDVNFQEDIKLEAIHGIFLRFLGRHSFEIRVTDLLEAVADQDILKTGASLFIPPQPIHLDLELATPTHAQTEAFFPVYVELILERPASLVESPEKLLERIQTAGEVTDEDRRNLALIQRSSTMLTPQASHLVVGNQEERVQTTSLRKFAVEFQEAFPDLYLALSHERIRGAGKPAGSIPTNQVGEFYLWAVHIVEATSPNAIHYNILEAEEKIRHYAPRPISRNLFSGKVKVREYSSGTVLDDPNPKVDPEKGFSGIDLNLLARDFLVAVEDILDPAIALENLGKNPSLSKELNKILACKEKLATAISDQLIPVLTPTAGTPADSVNRINAAKAALKKQLLESLVKGFDQESIIQFEVDVNYPHSGESPRLYGQPEIVDIFQSGSSIKGESDLDFTLSSSQLPLSNTTSYLSFVFNTQSPEKYEDIKFEFSYKIQSLEHDIVNNPEFGGYEDSSFLTFLLPEDLDNYQLKEGENLDRLKAHIDASNTFRDFDSGDTDALKSRLNALTGMFKTRKAFLDELQAKLQVEIEAVPPISLNSQQIEKILAYARLTPVNPNYLGEASILIPLRSYPQTPIVLQHRADEDPDSETTLEEIRNWVYNYTYEHQDVAQDTIFSSIHYNVAPQTKDDTGVKVEAVPELFKRLIEFSEIIPFLKKDIQNLGKPLPGEDAGAHKTRQQNVLQSFAKLVEDVSATWKDRSNTVSTEAVAPISGDFVFNEELFRDDTDNRISHIEFDLEIPRIGDVPQRISAKDFPEVAISGFDSAEAERFIPDPKKGDCWKDPAIDDEDCWIELPNDDSETEILKYKIAANEEGEISTNLGESQLRDRTIIIPNRDILEQQNAWASVFLVRNKDLKAGENTNPAFIFRTPEVRFKTKVTPFIINNERWDIRKDVPGAQTLAPDERTLENYLKELFKLLLPEKAPHHYDIRMGCQYAFAIAEGNVFTVDLLTYLPVVLGMRFTLKKDQKLNSKGFENLVKNLNDAVKTWEKENSPDRTKGMYIFSLSLFSHLDSNFVNLPLLKVEHLGLRLKDINF